MKEPGIRITMSPRLVGIAATAAKCGITPVHLRYVMRGERRASPRLRKALTALGVTRRLDGEKI